MRLEVLEELPVPGDGARSAVPGRDCAQYVVKSGLVIEVVETDVPDVYPVILLPVHFRDEDYRRELFLYLGNQPFKELGGNQLHHVASESVHAAPSPVPHYPVHCIPSSRSVIVDLDGIAPVVVVPAAERDAAVTVGIVAPDMVRHEIDDELEAEGMHPADQCIELRHPLGRVGSQVGIDVVIVVDGVRRAGVALHEGLAGRMPYDARAP